MIIFFLSCKKQTTLYATDQISDYLPLKLGSYIIYRTDSTVFTNFGRKTEVHSYLEKQVVDAQITDGLDRPSYRIFRYLTDTSAAGPWVATSTLWITPLAHSAEFIEDNLRVIKIILPIQQGITWNGNRFLPDKPYSSLYTFSNDNGMNSATLPYWNYAYSNIDSTLTFNGQSLPHVLVVNGVNESNNVNDPNPADYQSLNYIQDMYAKGIGIIYQNFIMWEYQPNTGGPGGGFKVGFGVKRYMVNHS
ncbi:MAG: hypothetical protein NVS1B13_06140 [Flavisolibacter sp.]